jgi:hypothetical protein
MEALAILGNHNSVDWIAFFNKNIASYSDNGMQFNAFYGTRIRQIWDDQLEAVIRILGDDDTSRQAVINIWNPTDLTKTNTLDKACNLSLVASVNQGVLDIIVFNRSNDAVWGAVTGANEVQFYFIQQYIADALNIPIGTYTHVTNNLHMYLSTPQYEALCTKYFYDAATGPTRATYPRSQKLFFGGRSGKMEFDADLRMFLKLSVSTPYTDAKCVSVQYFSSIFFKTIVLPMYNAWVVYKRGDAVSLKEILSELGDGPYDWLIAARAWYQRRVL